MREDQDRDQGQDQPGAPAGKYGVDGVRAVAAEVNKSVARFSRKFGWRGVREDDLRGEAWLAALTAERGYSPEKGAAGPYVGKALTRNLTAKVLFAGSPVSASWHTRKDLKGIVAVPVAKVEDRQRSVLSPEHQRAGVSPASSDGGPGIMPGAPDEAGWADEVLDDRRWRVRVLARLVEVVGEEGRAGLEELLRETPRRGNMSKELAASVALARERIAEDQELWEAWDDL